MDGVATLCGGNLNQAVRLVHGATAKLKSKNLSVWIANDKTQQRGVKQYYVTAADGYLLVAVVVIKDSKIPRLEFKLWSTDGGYELWTVFLPNLQRAAARNTPISDAVIEGTHRRNIVQNARAEVRNQSNDDAFDDLGISRDDASRPESEADPEDGSNGDDVEGGPNEGASLGIQMMEHLFSNVFAPAMCKRREAVVGDPQVSSASSSISHTHRVNSTAVIASPIAPSDSPNNRTNGGSRSIRNAHASRTASTNLSTSTFQVNPNSNHTEPSTSSNSSCSSSSSRPTIERPTYEPLATSNRSPAFRNRMLSSSSIRPQEQSAAGLQISPVPRSVASPIREAITANTIRSAPRNLSASVNVGARDLFVDDIAPYLPENMVIMNNEYGEPILFMYDGDFEQIEATWNLGLATCNSLGIEIFKIPGGGSLQWQPNDLMRAHNIIHTYCNSSKYHAKVHEFQPPHWLKAFENSLQLYGIDKASRDCFVNFMRQIPVILSQAFSVTTTRGGWKGLYPPNSRYILKKCDQFDSENFNDEERKRIEDTIDQTFIPESSLSGMIDDARITEVLGDLVGDMTHKFNFINKPTNHQRAIWWNSCGQAKSGVLLVRANELKGREDAKKLASEVAARKAAKAVAAAKKAEVDLLFLGGNANFTEERTRRCYCSNECGLQQRDIVPEDDGWRGCPVAGCLHFYCSKVNCQKKIVTHVKLCMQRLPIV
jgi:hypothetical protein